MNRSVMMRPGSTRFTVTPSLATSPARVLNIPAMAGRMPLERTRPSTGCLTELDWMARMRPHFLRFMSGSTARMKRTVDRRTCSKAAFHCSSVIWSHGPAQGRRLAHAPARRHHERRLALQSEVHGVLRSGNLLVEIGPVTARDVQALELVVPHHLERDALAGSAPPEREVEIPLRGNLAGIEGDNDIPFLDARARAR